MSIIILPAIGRRGGRPAGQVRLTDSVHMFALMGLQNVIPYCCRYRLKESYNECSENTLDTGLVRRPRESLTIASCFTPFHALMALPPITWEIILKLCANHSQVININQIAGLFIISVIGLASAGVFSVWECPVTAIAHATALTVRPWQRYTRPFRDVTFRTQKVRTLGTRHVFPPRERRSNAQALGKSPNTR